ncbi:MAG: sulfate reduction electron transfer complex DsrMKJOP subunit DsrM [Planctomycetes bacterium]|nr:sulfate reduction electron transfer complex DsrMKJOP subunit DsrM [Planctomycetota bacterium]
MRILVSLVAVVALYLLAWVGVGVLGLRTLFGTVLPYAALALFVCGVAYRVVRWAAVPVPFRIPTTCGQQRSLEWIKPSPLENPHTGLQAFLRMALEVLFFRSLLRNTKAEVRAGGRLIQGSSKWLWAGALAFHWCFLVVLVRHTRFFTEPVPWCVNLLAHLDGFLQVGVPAMTLSSVVLLGALGFLLARRLVTGQVRYISLPADYFPLFLLLSIVATGLLLRHVVRTDLSAVKEVAMGLVTFAPSPGEGAHWLFYVHLFFVSVLLAYFPFSKLMHMGGVFLSPTRNLANNNRAVRHINPWDYPVKVHTYEEYEGEFREKLKTAGIPLEKE